MSDQQFDVFLCHNSEDKPAVIEIAKRLQQKSIRPWLDEWELRPGLPWQEILEKQILKIKSAAVFIGSSGIGPWQDQEIRAFLQEFARRECPVIPVILSTATTQPVVPLFLNAMTWVDFRKNSPDPLERLSWGITGNKDQRNNLPVVVPEVELSPSITLNDSMSNIAVEISPNFKESLQDTGIKFPHKGSETFCLDNFFVYPDLKVVRDSFDELPLDIKGEEALFYSNKLLIFGDEQSGKTTFARKLFLDALESDFIPILIDGSTVRKSNIHDEMPQIVTRIYPGASVDKLLENPNLLCIVDDISANRLSKSAKGKFFKRLNSLFPRVILLAEESFQFVAPDFEELDGYKKLEMLPFGHVRRGQLVKKWVELELTEEVDDLVFWKRIDEHRLHIDSLVRKNVVPAKPFYILLLLQSFETITPQRLELTSYGHYYQYLVYQALLRARVKQSDIDTYLNVLSEFGKAILSSPSETLDDDKLGDFFGEYSENFLPVNQDIIVDDLVRSCILKRTETGLKFRYRYLFYFFAAKNLADSLHRNDAVKQIIQRLVDTIHLEKSANIILFLTHHTKDPWILEEIIYAIMDIFPEEEATTLEPKSLDFLKDFIQGLPEVVVENRDAQEERLEEDERKDEIEKKEREEIVPDLSDSNESNDEDKELEEFIKKVNKSFRVTEVCGQILRNRIGSLEREALEMIYEESLMVSLRFLNILLKSSEYMQDEVIRKIQRILEQSPKRSDSDITQEAGSFYMALNYLAILAILNKTSFSLGSARGREIYTKVTKKQKTPATRLIQEIIELQFEKRLDFKKVEKLHQDFSGNPICARLLKQIILRHCYMHDIGFRDRQRLADKLGIPIDLQRSVSIALRKRSQ